MDVILAQLSWCDLINAHEPVSERSKTEIGSSAAAEKGCDEDERETGRACKAG